MRYFIQSIFMTLLFMPGAAIAACLNPGGDAGDQIYNTTYNVMQYCNGQHWVAMGSMTQQGDNLGNHMAAQAIDMSGFTIQNLAPPTANAHAATKQYVDTVVAGAAGVDIPVDNPSLCTDQGSMRWIWDANQSRAVLTCADMCQTGGPGSVCMDGAIFVGLAGVRRIYVAPTDETGTYDWGGVGCVSGATDLTDGKANTDRLVSGGASPCKPHPAADICRARGPSWYLPADNEFALIAARKSSVPNLPASGYYWTSSEYDANRAHLRDLNTYNTPNTKGSRAVRCVRR